MDSEGFEEFTWLFACDSRNRGIIRQGFDEAALLWKAVRASSGSILEIGRNRAGSTVLLAAATQPDRQIYSIDIKSKENHECKEYLSQSKNKDRVHLIVADSRTPLPNLVFGFLFIDGDHNFEGVLADVVAHWNSLQQTDQRPALAAFHDALPNDNFKWRDADRRLKRFSIRFKNRFRKKKKPEIAPGYATGVATVCDELLRGGLAKEWARAGSMLVLQKAADLPLHFSETAKSRSWRNQSSIQFENQQKALRVAKDFLRGRIRVMEAAEQLALLSSDCVGIDHFDTDLFTFVMIHTQLNDLIRHSAPKSMDDPQILSFEAECLLKAFHAASNLAARHR